VHFVHSKATSSDAIPLLFLHGWPGSFVEVMKALPALNEAGFNVVAPSLPEYGFSTYPDEAGFDHRKHAEVLNALMLRLEYDEYVVQGGDWAPKLHVRSASSIPSTSRPCIRTWRDHTTPA
jgi:pimeloyl-ACP methyl ester carboxylesterase